MYGVSSQIDDKYMEFAGGLPHGSGIDLDWNVSETNQYVYFGNSYHCMDDNGMYDGWQDFSIRIERVLFDHYADAVKKANTYKYEPAVETAKERVNVLFGIMAENFALKFNNGDRLARKYFLRDYLEDAVNWSILNMKVK